LERSEKVLIQQAHEEIDRSKVLETAEQIAATGLRTIGVRHADLGALPDPLTSKQAEIKVGLIGIVA
jgi:hypothetical protein